MLVSFEKCGLDQHHVSLLKQSYVEFCAAENDAYNHKRTETIVNGEVVSELESDSPEFCYQRPCVPQRQATNTQETGSDSEESTKKARKSHSCSVFSSAPSFKESK